jgi:CHAT domain-containing protein/tetratricopeptide (TPR) repeat protein
MKKGDLSTSKQLNLEKGNYLLVVDQSDIDVRIFINAINSKLSYAVDSIFERGIDEELYFQILDNDKLNFKFYTLNQTRENQPVKIVIYKFVIHSARDLEYVQALKLERQAVEVKNIGNKNHTKESLKYLKKAQKKWKKIDVAAKLARNQMLTAYVAYYNYQWLQAKDNFKLASGYYQNTNQKKYAMSMTYLAATMMELQQYQRALELLNQAKYIQKKNNYGYDMAITVNFLGNLAYYQSDIELASRYFIQASKLFDLPNSLHKKATVLANYGVIQISIGNYLNAIEYLNNSLSIYSNDKQYEYATTLVNIAYAQRKFGYLQDSLVTYKKALKLHQAQNNTADIVIVLKGMANLSRTILDHKTALLYQQKAVSIARNTNEHGALSHALVDLAKDYQYLGQKHHNNKYMNEAELSFEEALKITKNHKLKAEVLFGLSVLYHKSNRFKNATNILQQAKRELELSMVKNSSLLAKINSEQVRQSQSNSQENIILLKQSLNILQLPKESELAIKIGLQLSNLLMDNQQFEKANLELNNILKRYNNLREKAGNPWIRNKLTELNYQIIEVKLKLLPHIKNSTNKQLSFKLVEQAKLSSFREQLADSRKIVIDSIDSDRRRELDVSQQALIASMVQYEKLKLINKDELAIKSAKDNILKKKYNLESSRASFYKNNPKLANLIYPQSASLVEVQNWLKLEQEKLQKPIYFISYFIGNKNGYGWIIGTNSFDSWKLPKTVALEKIINEYNYNVSHNTMTSEHSISIREKLMPIAIEKQAIVYIAPDSFLSNFPFSTLIDKDGSKLNYWIETNQISLILSISTFLTKENVKYKNDNLLLVSGPLSKKGNILKLSSTDAEINAIQQSWHGISKTFYHHQSSLNDFLNLPLNQYRFLHFATHAISNSEISELSGLAFENNNGIKYLNLSQIYGLSLSSQLVTLSSCDSGIGKNVVGEGIISLARGFLFAGSESVLATLWQVPDRSSKVFMVQFYKYLSESLSPLQALNKTQNAAIAGKLGRTLRSPSIWSAFTLISN